MAVIPAFRGELGNRVRYHAPQVYGLGPGHVVEIESGDEALYPLAAEYRYVGRAADDTRRKRPARIGPEQYFVPEPYVRQNVPTAEIVLAPRQRNYGSSKNWCGWPELAAALTEAGRTVVAAGAPDSSAAVACPCAWKYERFLDASIEAIRQAKLVIATASGLSLLAVLCGAPLLLVSYRGRVAPGPQVDARGRVLQHHYGRLPIAETYNPLNHTRSPIHVVDGWERPALVVEAALRLVDP